MGGFFLIFELSNICRTSIKIVSLNFASIDRSEADDSYYHAPDKEHILCSYKQQGMVHKWRSTDYYSYQIVLNSYINYLTVNKNVEFNAENG